MGRVWLQCIAIAVVVSSCGGGGGGAGCTSSTAVANATAPSATGPSATLTWDAVCDPRVAGYRVYYGTGSRDYVQAKGDGINAGNSTIYVVTGLDSGRTYYFAITAYDAWGNESDFSNEGSKSIP